MKAHRLYRFLLPADLEQSFAAELWEMGTLGLEIRPRERDEVEVHAYFSDLAEPGHDVRSSAADWKRRGVLLLAAETLPGEDWLARYRAEARPLTVGARLLVDPRDPPGEVPGTRTPEGRLVLWVPARNAFGTGSHESTRLAVAWLEETRPRGLSVLDVGTGSGILAFAALALGARRVFAFDLDLPSVASARANARANRLVPSVFAGRVHALAPGPRFDLAVVNVLPERILGELPEIVALLAPGARLISSGNLRERRDELLGRFASLGLTFAGEKREGEWVAFLLARGAAP